MIPLVVGIEKGDVRTACFVDPVVSRGARSRVRLAQQPKARIRERGDGVAAAVRRAVVDDDRFEVSQRLRRDRGETTPHRRGLLIEGHDDADEGHANGVAGHWRLEHAPSTVDHDAPGLPGPNVIARVLAVPQRGTRNTRAVAIEVRCTRAQRRSVNDSVRAVRRGAGSPAARARGWPRSWARTSVRPPRQRLTAIRRFT